MRRANSFALRSTIVTVMAIVVVVAFAYMAGGRLAGGPSSAAAAYEYQYGNKVTICHRTDSDRSPAVTISVATSAVPALLAGGDTPGPCP
jgi:hypothetical protein